MLLVWRGSSTGQERNDYRTWTDEGHGSSSMWQASQLVQATFTHAQRCNDTMSGCCWKGLLALSMAITHCTVAALILHDTHICGCCCTLPSVATEPRAIGSVSALRAKHMYYMQQARSGSPTAYEMPRNQHHSRRSQQRPASDLKLQLRGREPGENRDSSTESEVEIAGTIDYTNDLRRYTNDQR
jgi:hypothetical protein